MNATNRWTKKIVHGSNLIELQVTDNGCFVNAFLPSTDWVRAFTYLENAERVFDNTIVDYVEGFILRA